MYREVIETPFGKLAEIVHRVNPASEMRIAAIHIVLAARESGFVAEYQGLIARRLGYEQEVP